VQGRRRSGVVVLVLVIFFVMSLFTNTTAPLIPEIISTFKLSLAAAGVLPFMFFVAYGLASIPAGIAVARSSAGLVILGAFGLVLIASLSFAIVPRYSVAIASLFGMGIAAAALQVAVNPILRTAGGVEQFAFYSTLAQLVFGAGSFLSPRLYASLVTRTTSWVSIYWVFAALAAMMLVVVTLARVPQTTEPTEAVRHRDLLLRGRRGLPRYFVAIFMYLGTEQGIASWMSQFLATYHHVDPRTTGASAVSWFWGLMTIGCLVGLGLLKLFDQKKVLIASATCAFGLLALGLFTPNATVALFALPAIGFFASVMWPIIFALGLETVPAEQQGTASGILCTAIIGGAIVPLIIGKLGDHIGLRLAMTLCFVTIGCVFSVGFWRKTAQESV